MKKSVKSLLGLVSKKSLSKDVPKTFQEPLQDDGLFRTEAAPSPPAAAPGILLFSLTSVDSRSILIGSFLNSVLILSVNFSGQKKYQDLEQLGSPLTAREPRYWWSPD